MTFPIVFTPPIVTAANIAFRSGNSQQGAASLTVPTGVAAGDLMLWEQSGNGLFSAAIPTGFDYIKNETQLVTARYVLAWKIADGTEGGSTLTGFGATPHYVTKLLVFNTNAAAVRFDSFTGPGPNFNTSTPTLTISNTGGIATPTIGIVTAFTYGGTSNGELATDDPVATGQYANVNYHLYQNGSTPPSINSSASLVGEWNYRAFYATILRNLPSRIGVIGGAGGVGHNPSSLVDGTTATKANTDSMGDLSAATVPQRLIFYVNLGVLQSVGTIKAKQLSTTSSGNFGFYYSNDNVTWTKFSSNDHSYSMTSTPTDFTCTNNMVLAQYVGVVCQNVAWTGLTCQCGELTIGISS
jgi:hypothetical protein